PDTIDHAAFSLSGIAAQLDKPRITRASFRHGATELEHHRARRGRGLVHHPSGIDRFEPLLIQTTNDFQY
ncbi:hypothetical protein WDZ92_39240, partial [Nostoc sp. NIES-2111]